MWFKPRQLKSVQLCLLRTHVFQSENLLFPCEWQPHCHCQRPCSAARWQFFRCCVGGPIPHCSWSCPPTRHHPTLARRKSIDPRHEWREWKKVCRGLLHSVCHFVSALRIKMWPKHVRMLLENLLTFKLASSLLLGCKAVLIFVMWVCVCVCVCARAPFVEGKHRNAGRYSCLSEFASYKMKVTIIDNLYFD